MNHKAAAAGRFKYSGVGNNVRPGVDNQRIRTVGNDCCLIDQRHLPFAELASAGDGVIDIGKCDARVSAEDRVRAVVGERELAATLKRDAVLDKLEIRLI